MAKQLTVRGLDARLERTLRAEAKRRGLSVNRTVLGLLNESTGLAEPPARNLTPPFEDLDHLAGTWSVEDTEAFDRQLSSSRQIDEELWR
jgi:hypothetical protein